MKTKLLLLLLLANFSIYAQTNLVPNGDFTTWTTGAQPESWTVENATSSHFLGAGDYAAELYISSSTAIPKMTTQIALKAGVTYTVKYRYKYLDANFSGDHPLSLKISAAGAASNLSSSSFASDNLWTNKETTFTADQNLSYDLSFSTFTFDNQPFGILIDDVKVYVEGSETYTKIPDVNFENKLIALGIDSGVADGQVLTSNFSKITSLDVSNSSISDLTGIQDFTALTSLNCNSNKLTNLDISNLNLTKLSCSNNQLTSLNVSNNIDLTDLDVSSNLLTALNLSKNTAINYLNLNYNSIEKIDLSANINLKHLFLYQNKITTIDLSKNTALISLNVARTGLSTIDVPNNINLVNLDCSYDNLTTLDLSNNIALQDLNLYSTKITSLDLSKNLKLQNLDTRDSYLLANLNISENTTLVDVKISSNKLTGVDLSKLTKLKTFYCERTTIKNLDFSTNTSLAILKLDDNRSLETVNLKNGANATINSLGLSMTNTPNLYCVLVDDVDYANTNWADKKDKSVNFSLTCETPEYVLIPDVEFETQLLTNNVDGVVDGKILKSRAMSIDKLYINPDKITDLTGLNSFTALTELNFNGSVSSQNNFPNVDISKLSHLTDLNVYFTTLKTIDISNNLELKSVVLYYNKVTSLDVSKNLNLEVLSVDKNQITSLDVTANKNLKVLSFDENQISKIDVSQNPALTSLYTYRNNLKYLDVSNNLNLETLTVKNNDLIDLDLSKNSKLQALNCSYTKLKSLDLSKNSALIALDCSYIYSLTNLNLKNGNNLNFKEKSGDVTSSFKADALTCIQVDNVDNANTNWSGFKNAAASFSDSCPTQVDYTEIPDANFEEKLIALKIDKDGKNGKVETKSIIAITTLDVSNSNIKDLTGINDFVSLNTLNCSENQLSNLVLYKNNLLTNLNCSTNNITAIDLSINTQLESLLINSNKLTTLDLSKNTALKEIECSGNNLYNLNLKNGNNANFGSVANNNFTENPNLLCIQVDNATFSANNWKAKDAAAEYSENCAENIQYTLIPDPEFERLLIDRGFDKDGVNGKVVTSNISNLTELYANDSDYKITDLTGVEGFINLEKLYCYHGTVAKLDVSKNLKLKLLDMADNKVTALDLTQNVDLESLNCGQNNLTTLNISKNKVLKSLTISENQLTTIDVSQNAALERLYIDSNKLTNIDVTSNLALRELSISGNKIATLNTSKNTALRSLTAFSNELTAIDVTQNKELTYLNAKKNQLTVLDVSQNKVLTGLEVNENKIETIDVSQNPLLTSLMVNSNQLTSVNLKNGKNTLINNNYISFTSNPKLYCIVVDDVEYANKNWLYKKDANATYNTECTGELVLPANNFTVESKGESCLGENNGEISIVGKASFAYNATINDTPYTFTNNALKVSALTPGVYKIKITIPEMVYEQNFNVTIAKGATITGKSNVASKKVNVEITEGTAPFTVFVDGTEQFQTTDTNFSLNLATAGLVEIATAKACEGVLSKKVSSFELGTVLAAYPNPTSGSFEIEIPTEKNEVKIDLFNFAGQLISSKNYTLENGKALLNLENQAAGIYSAKVNLETPEYLKIIKN
ncbi:putative secreted protein (Por secretion system target) [Flavobacterium cutihirudinis]|uniref:Putative secreted protein (Por secretion system target) n=1 Tax=Flavobacterium cutihirudinis TaxID=1265740 RepID=A0A3D9FWG4_9FLAO|nr:T9SS type A sorting domain-containing protein [Flavobacterium cutihirudinis]RED25101.1 putative secreted protein (Por secretion system target) [Flavobacterium cutihirudinis]